MKFIFGIGYKKNVKECQEGTPARMKGKILAFTINAGIENLADKRYRPYSSGISASGRNFILSLRANF